MRDVPVVLVPNVIVSCLSVPVGPMALPAVARRDGIQARRWRRYVLPDGSVLLVSVGIATPTPKQSG